MSPLLQALDGETWRAVVGSANYEVSSLGRVRSRFRRITRSDGRKALLRGRVLEATPASDGRLRVTVDGRTRPVHLLVLEAFHGPRPDGKVGRHKEGPGTDNRASNLEWSADVDRRGSGRREVCSRGHRRDAPNLTPHGACLACTRGHSTAFRAANRALLAELGKAALIQREADRHYADLIRAVAA